MKTVCKHNYCSGCMACSEVCSQKAICVKDELSAFNAYIDTSKCINCNACYKICQYENPPELIKPQKWYQGWTRNQEIRMKSSSGGIATAISLAFIEKGGYVCSCRFVGGTFGFSLTNDKDEVLKFRGSKYVKSNLADAYKAVIEKIKKGKTVLFIALPCQVAAMKKYVGDKYKKNLFTIDLICHGAPSSGVLNIFLSQYGRALLDLENISFRKKGKYQVNASNLHICPEGILDRYVIAFHNALSFTDCCYRCNYAQISRVGDLTLGDSWGTDLNKEEQKKGFRWFYVKQKKGLIYLIL